MPRDGDIALGFWKLQDALRGWETRLGDKLTEEVAIKTGNVSDALRAADPKVTLWANDWQWHVAQVGG